MTTATIDFELAAEGLRLDAGRLVDAEAAVVPIDLRDARDVVGVVRFLAASLDAAVATPIASGLQRHRGDRDAAAARVACDPSARDALANAAEHLRVGMSRVLRVCVAASREYDERERRARIERELLALVCDRRLGLCAGLAHGAAWDVHAAARRHERALERAWRVARLIARLAPATRAHRGGPVPTDACAHYGVDYATLSNAVLVGGAPGLRWLLDALESGSLRVEAALRVGEIPHGVSYVRRTRRWGAAAVRAICAGCFPRPHLVRAWVRGGQLTRAAILLAQRGASWSSPPTLADVALQAASPEAQVVARWAPAWQGARLRREQAVDVVEQYGAELAAEVFAALGEYAAQLADDPEAGSIEHGGVLGQARRMVVCVLEEETEDCSARAIRRVARVARQIQARLRDAAAAANVDLPQALRQVFRAAAQAKIPPTAVASWVALREWCSAQGYPWGAGAGAPPVARTLLRARDRLAQRDRAWAVAEYPHEYARGRRLAPLYARILDACAELARQHPLVVHGRDGEMIWQVAHAVRPRLARRMRYVLSSRPLTTQASGHAEGYLAYLRRVAPPRERAVHVDTGFAGSIPRWFATRGWRVARLALVSADRPQDALLAESSSSAELRQCVLSDLEYAAQRLCEATSSEVAPGAEGRRRWLYSHDAPGFWARFYGIVETLREEGQP